MDQDRHVRRSGDDYLQAFVGLLPQGQAWPRALSSVLYRTCRGLTSYWGIVDGRAGDLLERESDPRKATDVIHADGERDGLLPEWERAWGLPDPCFPSADSIAARQRMLLTVMTWMGGQSRKYFLDLLHWLGYENAYIKEFAPFMAGISRVGDTREPPPDDRAKQNYRWYIGPAEQRFVWQVNIKQIGLSWFRAGSSQAGVHHHLEFQVPTEIVCLLDRWKPAHTVIVPDYSEITAGGPMQ